MFFLGVILPKIVAHVAHAGRWGASCGALTLRGGKNMQRRGAAGLLLLGLLLGTCLAGSRAQWVCMGGHLPGGGRDRGVQGSPNKTPLTSPDALFYLHHLRSCAMCPVGAVATGGIGTTGGVGWTFLRFALALATLCACCAAGCGNCRGWACSCWRPPRFSTLPHPISRSLSWFSSSGLPTSTSPAPAVDSCLGS